MTIKKRLARSNIAMFVIPVLAAVVLLLIGVGLALFLLKQVYLPRLGLSMHDLRQAGEQFERVLSGASTIFGIYAGTVIAALLLAIGLTNFCLTRSLFRHIAQPLDTLTAGVARIRDGDLDTPISYGAADEFKAACDALDEMAARLKTSLEEQQAAQQQKQELIWGLESMGDNMTVAVHVNRLREKIEDDSAHPQLLQTVWGVGYRLCKGG